MTRRPTPEPLPLTALSATRFGAELIKQFDKHIEQSENTLTEWKNRLNVNPASAFDWSQEVLTATARWEAYHELRWFVVGFLEKNPGATADALVKILRDFANERFRRHATDSSSSTSPMSNEMNRNRRLAWARIADSGLGSLEYLLERAHRHRVQPD